MRFWSSRICLPAPTRRLGPRQPQSLVWPVQAGHVGWARPAAAADIYDAPPRDLQPWDEVRSSLAFALSFNTRTERGALESGTFGPCVFIRHGAIILLLRAVPTSALASVIDYNGYWHRPPLLLGFALLDYQPGPPRYRGLGYHVCDLASILGEGLGFNHVPLLRNVHRLLMRRRPGRVNHLWRQQFPQFRQLPVVPGGCPLFQPTLDARVQYLGSFPFQHAPL